VPYTILYDEMGFVIRIGVSADLNEEQLKATLITAANEHQNDVTRDYLMMEHLLIEAYLQTDGRLSSVIAGRLTRYVPPRHPESARETPSDPGRKDRIVITLDEAKASLGLGQTSRWRSDAGERHF
jgi:hypothetical protein